MPLALKNDLWCMLIVLYNIQRLTLSTCQKIQQGVCAAPHNQYSLVWQNRFCVSSPDAGSSAEGNVSKHFTKSTKLENSVTCEEKPLGFSTVSTPASDLCINEKQSLDIGGNQASADSVSRDDHHTHPSDNDQTEEYSLTVDEAESARSPVRYSAADFESVDESDNDDDLEGPGSSVDVDEGSGMGKYMSKRRSSGHEDVSDNSSDENMDASRKQMKPRAKKYRQTTLNFGGGPRAAASSSTSDSDSGSRGRVTRRALGKGATAGGESFYKRMGDRDTENYRLGYPGQRDDLKLNANLRFYKNEISSYPDGAFIDEIHNDWWGNFGLLERHHGYIQWIFPIREEGMNWSAQALQQHEAKGIIEDKDAHNRVMLSYEMMLDFYGMKLEDRRTGKIQRSKRWRECYENLNYSSHNYLRITRILKSLGEFQLEHLKKPFLDFILLEIFEHDQLKRTLNSLKNYWIGTIKDDADREDLHKYVEEMCQ
ncbi:hypothetical protein EGW08_011178 [Elysia chlorotica]|uniref:Opioid growth factor receptor (OGFr) conserved domain-containing protein n=1 Tax=Elysia chlorotica TaxID=188477 RepID=A0A433THP5_ELYCH|nr:hypothetical protein EGW08_011178 [Elysia chlorotica]